MVTPLSSSFQHLSTPLSSSSPHPSTPPIFSSSSVSTCNRNPHRNSSLLSSALSKPKTLKMGSRLGRRVVHFPNLPLKILLPNLLFDSICEFALKTIPSASTIEIRRVLESLYGFKIDDVQTLNMEGKKKKRGSFLAAKPDYKKDDITLKNPLSISPELFPIPWVMESMKEKVGKRAKPVIVEEEGEEEAGRVRTPKHWLGSGKGGEERG